MSLDSESLSLSPESEFEYLSTYILYSKPPAFIFSLSLFDDSWFMAFFCALYSPLLLHDVSWLSLSTPRSIHGPHKALLSS